MSPVNRGLGLPAPPSRQSPDGGLSPPKGSGKQQLLTPPLHLGGHRGEKDLRTISGRGDAGLGEIGGRRWTPAIVPQHSKAVGHTHPPLLCGKGTTSSPAGTPTSPTTSRQGGHPRPLGLGKTIRGMHWDTPTHSKIRHPATTVVPHPGLGGGTSC